MRAVQDNRRARRKKVCDGHVGRRHRTGFVEPRSIMKYDFLTGISLTVFHVLKIMSSGPCSSTFMYVYFKFCS